MSYGLIQMAGKKGAPLGNKNGTKGRQYFEALRSELATLSDPKRKIELGHALRAVARAQILAAVDGDTTAMRDLADRLDGKPTQPIIGAGEDGEHLHAVEFRIVDPKR